MSKLTYTEVAKETFAYYLEDPERRAFVSEKKNLCAYINPEGKVCAVGRYLAEPEVVDAVDSVSGAMEVSGLKSEVSHLTDIAFWQKLQNWHDRPGFWGGTDESVTKSAEWQIEVINYATELDNQVRG